MGYDTESIVTIVVLLGLTGVYVYLLFAPSQPRVAKLPLNVVIKRDSKEAFQQVLQLLRTGYSEFREEGMIGRPLYDDVFSSSNNSFDWKNWKKEDDFFLDGYANYAQNIKDLEGREGNWGGRGEGDDEEEKFVPLVPSASVLCSSDWISIRSEMNYRYLWMHGNEEQWMGASATMDTPLHRKAFRMHPVKADCSEGGWVLLQEGDSDSFVQMIHPNRTAGAYYDHEAWVVKLGTDKKDLALADPSYHFILEKEGFVVNKECMACINVMAEHEYMVRGHSAGWNTHHPAGREFGAMVTILPLNQSDIGLAIAKEKKEEMADKEADAKLVATIASFPLSKTEKRVISFGLYGSKPKYTIGAIRNVELAQTYFPGWTCRFYVTSDVPKDVLEKLTTLGAEIREIPSGMGYASGMFWRFLVASDPSVDRYIVRDSDSRLNARDRIAVEEWIRSGRAVHIQRDHVNHCIVMNGGMWGGTKDALPEMQKLVDAWEARNEYMADLHFLEERVWPLIKRSHIAHDSYCCDRFPHTHPYPTQRYANYQHVGQVFDELDRPRLTDIDGFIRAVPIPSSCRKNAEWIYG